MKGVQIFIIALIIALTFTSCTREKKDKAYIIGFSQCMGADKWRKTMLEEMKRELSFHNNNIEFRYTDADGNSDKQVKQIESLMSHHIDLLIVSPNEVQPLSKIIQKVYDAGIPVVIIDRRTNSKKYTAFIGAENFEVGQNAGRYAAFILKGKGNVMEVTGLPDASPVIDRHNGFMDIISHYPAIKFLKKIDGNWEIKPFNKTVEENLRTIGNIDLIFAQNDRMAFDVYKICKKLNLDKKIKIIGIDGLPLKDEGLDMVENKYINATVLYPTGGQEAILTALSILTNKPYKKENQLFTTIIDSSNVRIMKLQDEKVLKQQKDIEERQKTIDEQNLITENQSIIILFITITLTAALIFGGLSHYYLKENKKINSRLEAQNKEISEQKNQLIEISAKAEVAHQAKLNFFTNISHEFRTPLTLILSPLEELMDNSKVQATTKQTIHLVQKNVMRLYRLVNQLMDFRKIEFKKMQLKASANDIIAFTKEIVSSYEVLARNKNINLKFITSERSLEVWFDITMIDKVIFNLLSNAFKFTKENGFIYVTISKSKEFAIIQIEDNGIGMTKESIDHAFDPFFQGEYENYKGTGLGLALSKELIDIHHGSITVKSEKWRGTTFEIYLPLGKGHLEKKEIISKPDPETLITEDARIYTTELYEIKAANWNDEQQYSPQKKHSILIIEDNKDLREYLKSRFIEAYDIMEAENADVALQSTFDYIPDLIICDVVIPGKNGLDITKIIKNDIRTSHIPVILLTARNDDEQKIEGLKTKADAYITKPFNFQFLEQTINSLLHNREKTKDHYSGEVLIEEKSKASKKLTRRFISEFSAIVEHNIGNDKFEIDHICKELGISRIQLYRKVKTSMNCNVNQYIISTRLQKAKYYLQHEDFSISEVAFKTGFSSSTYFSTAFKASFGCTPSEFRSKKIIDD